MSLSEREIIIELHQGNESVFEDVFRNYYERLCNYANTFTNDMDEAEEMVQSTFLALWEKHNSIEIQLSVKSYLYRAVHNQCLNRIKHNKVRQEYGDDYRNTSSMETDNNMEVILGNELEQEMKQAIESLPTQCGTVFKMSRFESLTYAEIAAQLNLSVKTVDNHITKALKILRVRFKDYLPTIIAFFLLKN